MSRLCSLEEKLKEMLGIPSADKNQDEKPGFRTAAAALQPTTNSAMTVNWNEEVNVIAVIIQEIFPSPVSIYHRSIIRSHDHSTALPPLPRMTSVCSLYDYTIHGRNGTGLDFYHCLRPSANQQSAAVCRLCVIVYMETRL